MIPADQDIYTTGIHALQIGFERAESELAVTRARIAAALAMLPHDYRCPVRHAAPDAVCRCLTRPLWNALTGTGEATRACRVCGCTEDRACAPDATRATCHWVAEDLCSRCA